MVRNALFSHAVLADLLADHRCRQCGVIDQPLIVLTPEITERNNMIELKFCTLCHCGSTATFELTLPVLMLGYVLAREALRAAGARPADPYIPPRVQPSRTNLFRELLRGYTDLIRALPGGSLEPTAADQTALALGDSEWRDFLKRMELGPEERDQTNP